MFLDDVFVEGFVSSLAKSVGVQYRFAENLSVESYPNPARLISAQKQGFV